MVGVGVDVGVGLGVGVGVAVGVAVGVGVGGGAGAPVTGSDVSQRAASTTVCLQLHNAGTTFNIRANIDPNIYPYPITGGNISGTICGSPNWTLTGGSIGSNLQISGTFTGGGACAANISIAGTFAVPSSYNGSYGFPFLGFPHHTLFLGFQPTCP